MVRRHKEDCRAANRDLVQVGQAVGVLAESLVLSSEAVSRSDLPELLQVDHVEGAVEHTPL